MTPTYLKVQELDAEKKFGRTTDMEQIKYNLETFGDDYVKNLDELLQNADFILRQFTKAGRYLVYIKLSNYAGNSSMEFTEINEVEGDLETAKIGHKYFEEEGELFKHMNMWETIAEIRKSYLFNKDAVELVSQ